MKNFSEFCPNCDTGYSLTYPENYSRQDCIKLCDCGKYFLVYEAVSIFSSKDKERLLKRVDQLNREVE